MTLPFVPDSKRYKPLPSLWHVWLQSRRVPFPKFNAWAMALVLVSSITYVGTAKPDPTELLASLRAVVGDGFQFAGVILGFLLAGFTVFATLSARDFFHALAAVQYQTPNEKEVGLSWLEFCYCVFIETMAFCLAYMGGCLAVRLMGFPSGPVASLLRKTSDYESARRFVIYIAFVVVVSSTVLLLLALKSFIFNVYSLLLNALRFEAVQLENEAAAKAAEVEAVAKAADEQAPTS